MSGDERESRPISHLANGNFNNSPSDEVNDYIEMQWANYSMGG